MPTNAPGRCVRRSKRYTRKRHFSAGCQIILHGNRTNKNREVKTIRLPPPGVGRVLLSKPVKPNQPASYQLARLTELRRRYRNRRQYIILWDRCQGGWNRGDRHLGAPWAEDCEPRWSAGAVHLIQVTSLRCVIFKDGDPVRSRLEPLGDRKRVGQETNYRNGSSY